MKLAQDTPPDLQGSYGQAWQMDVLEIAKACPHKAPVELTVASWIAHAPYAHPFWAFYWIGCVGLRDVPGVPPAIRHMAGATHEIMVCALDPDHPPVLDQAPRLLMPMNFCGQFIEPSDEAAATRVTRAVQDVINALLNPDTDFRGQWIQRFSDSNVIKSVLPPVDLAFGANPFSTGLH